MRKLKKNIHRVKIKWNGPYSIAVVRSRFNKGGSDLDGWTGADYGIYQIYGKHILYDDNMLLYIGQASDQTFSQRFKEHYDEWLKNEKAVKIYLGRIDDLTYNSRNNWSAWRHDVSIAEAILVYKYTPNYNSSLKGDYPKLHPYKKVRLQHIGSRGLIRKIDNAPGDYM